MLFRAALFCAFVVLCNACSCIQSRYPSRFCNYPVVVEGQATNVTRDDQSYPVINARYQDRIYTIEIIRAIKLPEHLENEQTIEVVTGPNGASCGVYFPLNERRIIFARSYNNRLRTGLCDPNGQLKYFNPMERQVLSVLNDWCESLERDTDDQWNTLSSTTDG